MALNNINVQLLKLSTSVSRTELKDHAFSGDTLIRLYQSTQISYNPYLYSPSMNYHTQVREERYK